MPRRSIETRLNELEGKFGLLQDKVTVLVYQNFASRRYAPGQGPTPEELVAPLDKNGCAMVGWHQVHIMGGTPAMRAKCLAELRADPELNDPVYPGHDEKEE